MVLPRLLMVLFNGPLLAGYYGLDKRAAFGLIFCLRKTRKDEGDMERQGGHGLLHYAAEATGKCSIQTNKTCQLKERQPRM